MKWEDLTTVKKGNIGEKIIISHLLKKGLIPYVPNFEGAHPFDFLCASLDKKNMVIVDAKAKARMNYPLRGHYITGINYKHYEEYTFLKDKYNIPIHLYFIDELEEKIYGNNIEILNENMVIKQYKQKMAMFRLSDMITVATLSKYEVAFLKQLSTRNYNYS